MASHILWPTFLDSIYQSACLGNPNTEKHSPVVSGLIAARPGAANAIDQFIRTLKNKPDIVEILDEEMDGNLAPIIDGYSSEVFATTIENTPNELAEIADKTSVAGELLIAEKGRDKNIEKSDSDGTKEKDSGKEPGDDGTDPSDADPRVGIPLSRS